MKYRPNEQQVQGPQLSDSQAKIYELRDRLFDAEAQLAAANEVIADLRRRLQEELTR
jgi:hypothetical protein